VWCPDADEGGARRVVGGQQSGRGGAVSQRETEREKVREREREREREMFLHCQGSKTSIPGSEET
jgi:hypothetical protein